MSPEQWTEERRSALAVMSPGEIQDACGHPRLNSHGECAVCGEWMTQP